MDETALLRGYLAVGAILFGLGLVGFLSRRNMIVMFISAEMMLQAISVSLVAWWRFHNNWGGQILTIFILTVAACEAAIALALVLTLYRRSGKLDIAVWQNLRESSLPAYVDQEIPEELEEDEQHWPTLTPSGVEPQHSERDEYHRTHV